MFDKLRTKLFTTSSKSVEIPTLGSGFYSLSSGRSTTLWDKGSVYDNSYASIKAIANSFVEIRPYAVNERGKEVKTSAVEALYSPNDRMSPAMFREALAVMTLTHRKAYILVWHKYKGKVVAGGKNITADNIVGYTFLEDVGETVVNGVKSYFTANHGTLTEQDVMEISVGVNPYNLNTGYSPAVAIKKWASVDDYIVAYEAGLFENGAVPAGQFIITAPNPDKFREIVSGMQSKHRGSGKNNNVQYVYRPIDPSTGQATSSQVEWIPFSQNNNSLALDAIFNQVNEKLDSAYGVPASIRGVSSNNNYASSAVDEAHFMKFTVKPFATKIWDSFTHELNRILDGKLGCQITFDLDEISMADENKVVAETKKAEIDILTAGLSAGYSAEKVIAGFGLNIDFEALGEPKTINISADDETDDSEPDMASESKKKHSVGCSCNHSHKKAELNDSQQAVKDELYGVIENQVDNQTGAVIDELEKQDDAGDWDLVALETASETSDEQNFAFASAMMAVLVAYMLVTGKKTYKQGVDMLPDDTTGATGYTLPEKTRRSYEDYLKNVGASFNGDTTGKIKDILKQSADEKWNKNQLKEALKEVSKTDDWRIERLAYNEERRAYNMADLDAMIELQNQTGVRISKTWHTADSGACDYCKEMAGHTENVSSSFLAKNETLTLEDGSVFLNDFVDMDVAQLHANCRCYVQYKVEKS